MAGESNSRKDEAQGTNTAMSALGYLLAGMAFWGFIGWLVDRWLGLGGIPTAVGIIAGMAGGVYLVVKRFGA